MSPDADGLYSEDRAIPATPGDDQQPFGGDWRDHTIPRSLCGVVQPPHLVAVSRVLARAPSATSSVQPIPGRRRRASTTTIPRRAPRASVRCPWPVSNAATKPPCCQSFCTTTALSTMTGELAEFQAELRIRRRHFFPPQQRAFHVEHEQALVGEDDRDAGAIRRGEWRWHMWREHGAAVAAFRGGRRGPSARGRCRDRARAAAILVLHGVFREDDTLGFHVERRSLGRRVRTKTRSPQTIGLACDRPGSALAHSQHACRSARSTNTPATHRRRSPRAADRGTSASWKARKETLRGQRVSHTAVTRRNCGLSWCGQSRSGCARDAAKIRRDHLAQPMFER